MGQPCSVCQSEYVREIDRRARASTPAVDIALWVESKGGNLSRHAIGRHLRAGHARGAEPNGRGPRVVSDDFLVAVRDSAHEDLREGVLRPSIRDGLGAAVAIEQRAARAQDRDLMARIALALTGNAAPMIARVLDPAEEAWEAERAALEAEYRPLLTAGDDGPNDPRRSASDRRAELQDR